MFVLYVIVYLHIHQSSIFYRFGIINEAELVSDKHCIKLRIPDL